MLLFGLGLAVLMTLAERLLGAVIDPLVRRVIEGVIWIFRQLGAG